MSSGKRSRTAPPSGYACPSCKQPVDAVVERHKTMGIFVPVWIAGPCHNPRCREYVPQQAPIDSVRAATWRSLAGWKRH
ncbi:MULTISPECIES: hypothetical protein [Streptomyces]|uniref:Uncharacterized protein n=1 Tax=Streptomyces fimbriatus TaxID=68197 RepID=A0ABW0D2I2_STRFI|nr:hypothetical protein [Streptomyces sp.]